MLRYGIIALAGVAVAAAALVSQAQAGGATHADATIKNAAGEVIGSARFTEDGAGRLHVNVKVKGVTPGAHGIHIHSVGLCEPTAFTTAGGHHNPLAKQHGLENPNGAHAGDLPVLMADEDGRGTLTAVSDRATISDGSTSIFDANGSAIVIHAAPDDQVTDPTGNSGARIACGVIEPS